MRFLTIAAIVLALFIFGPTLFLGVKSVATDTGLYVDISMMPQPAALFEKACGRAGSSVELSAWINTNECPKE